LARRLSSIPWSQEALGVGTLSPSQENWVYVGGDCELIREHPAETLEYK